jgi:uncharacterized protein
LQLDLIPGAITRLLFAMVAGLLAGTNACADGQALRKEPLTIVGHGASHQFTVEIADTEATREYGLMFRKHLGDNEGMLFDFKSPQPVAFWMKNTLIPLDMLFIAANGQVVSIARNATPMSETPIPSGAAILGVLEIRGGRAAEIGVAPGDQVQERIFHP